MAVGTHVGRRVLAGHGGGSHVGRGGVVGGAFRCRLRREGCGGVGHLGLVGSSPPSVPDATFGRTAVVVPAPARRPHPDAGFGRGGRGRHGVAAAGPRPVAGSAPSLVVDGRPSDRSCRPVGPVLRGGVGADRARPGGGDDERHRVVLLATVDPAESPARRQRRRPGPRGVVRRHVVGLRHVPGRAKVHVRTAGVSSATLFGVMRAVPGASDRVRRGEVVRARHRSTHALEDLRRAGLAVIDPVLEPAAVAQLRAFAERAPARLRLADGRVIDGTYAERHPDTTLVSIPGAFAWAHGEVQHVMASARLHELALARFGLAPVVHLPSLYWSCVPSTPSTVCRGNVRPRFVLPRGLRRHPGDPGPYVPHRCRLRECAHGVRPREPSSRVAARSGVPQCRRRSRRGRGVQALRRGGDSCRHRRRRHDLRDRSPRPAPSHVARGPRSALPRDGDPGRRVAGAYHRRRAVPVRDERFGLLLDDPRGPLRLFEAIADEESSTLSAASVARLA